MSAASSWRGDASAATGPYAPTASFPLQFPDRPEGRNRSHFFLEADRSTMPRERFVAKLAAYRAWHAAGGHTAALGMKSFRVLTVTKSEERLRSLLAAAAGASHLHDTLRLFWFSAQGRFSAGGPESVFERVWEVADERGVPKTILPGPG